MAHEIKKSNVERKQNIQFILLFLNALIATFIWIYYLSQGFSQPGILDGFIDIQASVLQKGHLAITPDYHYMFYHDVSLYNGNYYFYWGLLPSLLHAFLSILVGRAISSYFIVCLFLFLFVFFLQFIIFEILNTATPETSPQNIFITCAAVILSWVLIFNLPFPYDVYHYSWFFNRFVIYEQQILFGLGLAMPGLYFMIRGYRKESPALLITAASLFATAPWVRGTWFLFAVLAIPVIYTNLFTKKSLRSLLNRYHYAFMILPILFIAGLLVLNYVRFDNFFDFGIKLQVPIIYNDNYFRIQNGIFSPMTHFYNTIFKILSYYTSPGLIQLSGISERSASWSEFTAPYLFHNNPLLLLLMPLVLYGIYRTLRENKDKLIIIISIGSMALIMNGVIVSVGNIVTMRYFVECYYITILLLFAGLTFAIPIKYSVSILVLLLGFYIPGNIKTFLTTQPELRLIEIVKNKQDHVDYRITSPMRSFSVFKDIYWHEGTVTAAQETFTRYNTMGMIPKKNGMIYASDVTAIYIKPQKNKEISGDQAFLEFIGIKSVSKPGIIKVYLEKTKIGEFSVVPWNARSFSASINYHLMSDAPCRLLIYFFEGNQYYLPAKQSNLPSFIFEKISFSRL